MLQGHSKWHDNCPDLKVGDLVLLKDTQARQNDWPMAVITNTFPDKDGKVRRIKVKVTKYGTARTFLRPISETVFLMLSK
ncbi:hypothetical protein LDENG_00134220 [Lucifuga dentata]|nr:hypothetical protein LDENG_00134220 [Lucifuga dentata]